jgi:hypothetical protein
LNFAGSQHEGRQTLAKVYADRPSPFLVYDMCVSSFGHLFSGIEGVVYSQVPANFDVVQEVSPWFV